MDEKDIEFGVLIIIIVMVFFVLGAHFIDKFKVLPSSSSRLK